MKVFGCILCLCSLAMIPLGAGCSAKKYRERADASAQTIIQEANEDLFGRSETIAVRSPADTLRERLLQGQNLPYGAPASLGARHLERTDHWPNDDYLEDDSPTNQLADVWEEPMGVLDLSLSEALQVAAQNNREYQAQKEQVFRSALSLDLERDAFRTTFAGLLESLWSANLESDETFAGVQNAASLSAAKQLKNGATLTSQIGLDLVKLLSPTEASSRGLTLDGSIFIPMLRGAGRHIVTEQLQQAERNVVYDMYDLERFKREMAVRVAADYLSVLQNVDQVRNAEANYRGLVASARRARRLAEANELPPIQVDQANQDELRARERWIRARESYARSLDSFKNLLGLPTDADVLLDREELERLSVSVREMIAELDPAETASANGEETVKEEFPHADAPVDLEEPQRSGVGPFELEEDLALRLALTNRLDLRVAEGAVYDAQRGVVVAADQLRPELSLLGRGSVGQGRGLGGATRRNSDRLEFDRGTYSALISFDPGLERTSEAINYRNAYITLERAVRNLQSLEDTIKLQVRNDLRNLMEARESLKIQLLAEALAQRRVRSTNLYLEAGRVEMRDVLEAQEALLSAQNSLTAALVEYRVAELELQRDLGVLQVSPNGLWQEYVPEAPEQANGEDNGS